MSTYSGPCLGGPYNGKWLDHQTTTVEVFRAPPMFTNKDPKDLCVPELMGRYAYEFGCWLWRPQK